MVRAFPARATWCHPRRCRRFSLCVCVFSLVSSLAVAADACCCLWVRPSLQHAAVVLVRITEDAQFEPETVVVPRGTVVRWQVDDDAMRCMEHCVTVKKLEFLGRPARWDGARSVGVPSSPLVPRHSTRLLTAMRAMLTAHCDTFPRSNVGACGGVIVMSPVACRSMPCCVAVVVRFNDREQLVRPRGSRPSAYLAGFRILMLYFCVLYCTHTSSAARHHSTQRTTATVRPPATTPAYRHQTALAACRHRLAGVTASRQSRRQCTPGIAGSVPSSALACSPLNPRRTI
jgi:hypothetical protein